MFLEVSCLVPFGPVSDVEPRWKAKATLTLLSACLAEPEVQLLA